MQSRGFGRAYTRALGAGWRLVALRPVSREALNPTPENFAALVATDVLLTFAVSFAIVGVRGEINIYEFQRLLTFVPAALLVGLLARHADDRRELLVLPTAFAAATLPFTIISSSLYLLAQYGWLPLLEIYWEYFDYLAITWSVVVIVVAIWRLVGRAQPEKTIIAVVALVLLVAPNFWAPQGLVWAPRPDESAGVAASFHSLAEESAFYAQQGALERELGAVEPERPGTVDLYVLAAALYAGEDVFMKETRMITALLDERFDAAGRTVTLVNNPKTLQEHPVASLDEHHARAEGHRRNHEHAGRRARCSISRPMGTEQHDLAVDFRPIRFSSIDPPALKAALDESGIRWRIVVVSACYSGWVRRCTEGRTNVDHHRSERRPAILRLREYIRRARILPRRSLAMRCGRRIRSNPPSSAPTASSRNGSARRATRPLSRSSMSEARCAASCPSSSNGSTVCIRRISDAAALPRVGARELPLLRAAIIRFRRFSRAPHALRRHRHLRRDRRPDDGGERRDHARAAAADQGRARHRQDACSPIEVARALGAPLFEWHIKSTTKAQHGLYEYDAVSRLRDSQLGDAQRPRHPQLHRAAACCGRRSTSERSRCC